MFPYFTVYDTSLILFLMKFYHKSVRLFVNLFMKKKQKKQMCEVVSEKWGFFFTILISP